MNSWAGPRARGAAAGGVALLVALPWLLGLNPYFVHVLVLAAIYAVLASSLNLLTGYSGLLSLGHQAFFGVGAYVSALLDVRLGAPFPAGFLAGGLVALLFGWFIGGITLRLRSAYFVIATVAFSEIIRLVALNWVDVTNGPMGITNVSPPSFGPLAVESKVGAYYLALALLAATLYVCRRVVDSDLGRALVAMREFENLARSVGIDTRRAALTTFVISSALAGVAGSFYAHYLRFLSPEVFAFEMMATIVIMMLAGGMGTLVGPVIGAAIFTVVPEMLRFSDQYRLVLLALAIILLVRFLPQGLWGLALQRWRATRGRECRPIQGGMEAGRATRGREGGDAARAAGGAADGFVPRAKGGSGPLV